MRYIYADELKATISANAWSNPAVPAVVNKIIDVMPAADVVEVVRCKDCKYFISEVCRHDLAMNLSRADDFCSYGERKE